ncbi:MAG: amino acid ABC transporter substrate-binding protein [Beijerinckiaceae bacterium]|nr:amino acid ABC transporter substrate-binding protein [Beijerinckiaceae bacterium]
MRNLLLAVAFTASTLVCALPSQAQTTSTLERTKQRGKVNCGTSEGVPGFSLPDDRGNWNGFDIDWCRALAAAIFNDPNAISLKPLSAKDRLIALQSGEIDVLARTTTWTSSRDAAFGLNFTAVNYYDGQGFLARKSLNIKSAKDLNGASICVQQGTTGELNLADFARTNKIKIEVIAFSTTVEAAKSLEAGRCDAWTTDISALSANRLKFVKSDDFVVLPEVISKEPLGAWVRQGDDQWFDLVRWTLFVMINAEELGVTQANVEELTKTSGNPEIKRLLGTEAKFGEQFGVSNDWVVRIVRAVGNYGESFDRHLGPKTRLGLDRGLNKLWSEGGAMYAPPIR